MRMAIGLFVGFLAWGLASASFGDDGNDPPELRDIYGTAHYLTEFKDARTAAIVVMLLDEHCPVVKLSLGPFVELYNEYDSFKKDRKGRPLDFPKYPGDRVRFLGVYVTPDLGAKRMAAHALHSLIPFRVLFDAKLEFVKRYHLSRLSETIVFDSKWNVKYQGPLDDQLTQGSIKPRPMRRFVKDALDAILAGKEVAVPRLPAVGCMISPLRRDYPHVTFYKDAAPIFQNRCEVCHHEGAVGPMPLTTYKEICDYSGMIEEVVVDRRMPPWPGSSPHGFARSEELRSEESDTIIAWIRNGMKLGNPADAPEAKTWPKRNEWGIGKPDFVFTMPAPITVPAGGFIDYVYVPIEINGGRGFDDDRWIEAIEARPGAPQVVHHIQIHEFHGTTLSGKVSPLDQLRLYGLSIENARQLGSYAPGNTFENARIYSNYIQAARVAGKRVAMRLPQGSNLMLEMHYTPNGKSVQDQSEVAIRFAKSKPDLELEVWYSFRKRADLVIPANIENHTLEDIYHFGSHTDGKAVLIHAMEPHMHVRGKSFRLELVNAGAVNPRDMQDFRAHMRDHGEEILSVPVWDFGWEKLYRFQEPILVRPTQAILATASWDNTAHNPRNPDPQVDVVWGQQTVQEMFNTLFLYEVLEDNDPRLHVKKAVGAK